MDAMLSDCDFAIVYLDDILIKKIFKRISEYELKLAEGKCKFLMEKIKCLGQVIDESEHRLEPSRAITVQNMLSPMNVTRLQAFLGLVNLLPSVYPKWVWTEKCQKAFELKDVLTSDLYLMHFDPKTQFISCEMFMLEHKIIAPYHPRSNGKTEWFVDPFNKALKKANKEAMDKVAIQQFLRLYRVTLNPNVSEGSPPTELMFARKVKSVFDKLLPVKRKNTC
ncbi:uncharacterized protein LOC106872013 [Octopus bimaculoides]|uniref:uncharacterized protein LOC106872013 n=1 Tax=Octopus bimaculoides TaxID=37653 RepID=UPI00071D5B8A|nr:uncharacterized protein LOC106872013 [Octopus bimaculoides]|eukprot:XP_014774312.1 PREDICTED: uncharacterized protein LOC106872013 [Octopus bimaculoides]